MLVLNAVSNMPHFGGVSGGGCTADHSRIIQLARDELLSGGRFEWDASVGG